uniref:Uncharacterized protein n=1 Tax=Cucumis melo TaxID=3656 RepID=A0A9I9EI48_CUCME
LKNVRTEENLKKILRTRYFLPGGKATEEKATMEKRKRKLRWKCAGK